jgi:hypothetical protein
VNLLRFGVDHLAPVGKTSQRLAAASTIAEMGVARPTRLRREPRRTPKRRRPHAAVDTVIALVVPGGVGAVCLGEAQEDHDRPDRARLRRRTAGCCSPDPRGEARDGACRQHRHDGHVLGDWPPHRGARPRGEARAGYGEALLARLSADLTKRFGRGFSVDKLETARLFYVTYPGDEISEIASRKLPLGKSATRLGNRWPSSRLDAFPSRGPTTCCS